MPEYIPVVWCEFMLPGLIKMLAWTLQLSSLALEEFFFLFVIRRASTLHEARSQ